MKKLINKKTGEIAFIDLYTNTITFSHSKTTHKISIQKDPDSHSITKITTSPEPIPTPNEIKSELTSKSNTNPTSNPTPSINNSQSDSINNPNSNSTINHSPKTNPINDDLNTNSNNPKIEIIDDFSIFENIPETEIFDSPDPNNPNPLIPTYKISA